MEHIDKRRTLYDILFKQKTVLLDVFMILCSVFFLAVMANIRIPLWPVPITMQTFGVFVIAFFFGSRKGLLSILAYILAGIVGFGVFAGHKSGVAVVMGPTFGYIAGFLFCAFIVGHLIEKGYGRTKGSVFKIMIIGNLIIYFFGLVGLWRSLGNVGLWKILISGLFPFLIGDVIKIAGAVALFPYIWRGSEKLSS